MNVRSPPLPDVWTRCSPGGTLVPPLRRHPRRQFLSTDEGLIEIRCPPPPQRRFDPTQDVVLDLWALMEESERRMAERRRA